jgi:hypothetical protein
MGFGPHKLHLSVSALMSLPQPPVDHNDCSRNSGRDLSPNGSAVHAWPAADPTLAKGHGFALAVWKSFQPFLFHFGIHFSLKASNKYFESEIISTRHGCFKVSSPMIKAVNSIRLLVVHRKPALSSLRCAP